MNAGHVVFIHYETAPGIHPEVTEIARMQAWLGIKTQSQNNQVRLEIKLLPGNLHKTAPATDILPFRCGANRTQSAHAPGAIIQNGLRHGVEHKPGPLLNGALVVGLAAGHVRLTPAIDPHRLPGTPTDGHPEAIHGTLSRPKDHHPLPCHIGSGDVERNGCPLLQEERQGLHHPVKARAGNIQHPGGAGIHSQKDGIVTGPEVFKLQAPAQLHSKLEPDPEFPDQIHPALHH